MHTHMIKLCLILLVGHSTNSLDLSVTDVADILRFGRETVMDILESMNYIRTNGTEDNEMNFPFVKRMEREIRNRIAAVSKKLDAYQDRIEMRMDAIMMELLERLPLQQRLDNALRDFEHYIGQINDLYEVFQRYMAMPETYEKYTMEEFAKACVSPNLGALPDVLKIVHRLIVPIQNQVFNRSILILLATEMQEASSQICNEQQSPQQLLYNLYTTVAITEIKGYTMMQFSYLLLRTYNQGSNFTEEMELVKDQYAARTSETLRAVKTAMAFAPRDLWRCDPRKHKLDETYTELKQLFQGYIVNEVDMNADNTCRENCAYYSYARVYGCYQNQYCANQRKCNGKLLNCEYIDSDMWICPSDKSSSRRYEYIEYENSRTFGQKNTCSRGTMKVDSWWRWLFWHCSYCFCYCDDHNSSSDRYFSLREVVADISNNKVITGIKLTKYNQIIHMQIQEGKLLPRGTINSTSVAWKPLDKFSILDRDVRKDVDYHTLVWEKRALDLDDLLPPQNHLLTGVRFRMVGTRLNLEIRVTPFNFTTGVLINPMEKSYWHSNDITDRTELDLSRPDVPTRSQAASIPDSKMNQYLNFAPSDRETDAAQSTIPFLDIQPVEPKPPVPIAGAGVYHKGRAGSGGFVALKLITYNFAPHLQADLPPAPPIIDTPIQIKAT
uniref:Venom protein n=1 Tax=Ampulex compressa TaxID=860918 RepID=A0A1W6EW95_AMPCP|nr:venom protein [Ampulex compressa]